MLLGILAAPLGGFNTGGSPTGIAWGPAVGAGVIGKTAAAMKNSSSRRAQ
nr:hypothetical protein [Natrialba asiatica]